MTNRVVIRDTILKVLNDSLEQKIKTYRARGIPFSLKDGDDVFYISTFVISEQILKTTAYNTLREADLVVEGHTNKDIDDDGNLAIEKLDFFSDAVEEILLKNPTLDRKAQYLKLESVDFGIDEKTPDLMTFHHNYKITYYKEIREKEIPKIPSEVVVNEK